MRRGIYSVKTELAAALALDERIENHRAFIDSRPTHITTQSISELSRAPLASELPPAIIVYSSSTPPLGDTYDCVTVRAASANAQASSIIKRIISAGELMVCDQSSFHQRKCS